MGKNYRERDPILRLLPPDVPLTFENASDEEQAFRGRLWLVMWSAGYEPDHAWWFALSDDEDFIGWAREHLKTVPDSNIPLMVKGRVDFDRGKAMVPEGVVQ